MPVDGADKISFGLNPLLAAAGPLLQLLGRLRNTYSQPNPADLRERSIQQIRAFEQTARDAGVPMEQLRPAHYALCASLDDVVLNTPWGSGGAWAAASLVSTFHQEVRSGERFFDLLDPAAAEPWHLPAGAGADVPLPKPRFSGALALSPRGPGELERLREDLYTIIARQQPAPDPALSPHWQGVASPYRSGACHFADLGDGRLCPDGDRRAVHLVLDRTERGLG